MSIFKRKRRKAAVAKAFQRAADQQAQQITAGAVRVARVWDKDYNYKGHLPGNSRVTVDSAFASSSIAAYPLLSDTSSSYSPSYSSCDSGSSYSSSDSGCSF